MKAERVPNQLAPELFRQVILSLLPELPEAVVAPLYDAHAVQSFMPGEFLMMEGDVCTGLFLLRGGIVQVSLLHLDHARKHIDVRKIWSPAILGLPGVMLGQCFVASARAVTPADAAFIPRADFMDALREFPQASIAFSAVLADELDTTYQYLSALQTRSAVLTVR